MEEGLPQDGWALLRLALLRNHRQEQIDYQVAEREVRYRLAARHQQEMALLSLLVNPLVWARAIARYTAQQAQSQVMDRMRRRWMITRQEEEVRELDEWITQQQDHARDEAMFDQLNGLFSWSLTSHQRQLYHQAITKGDTLIVTDLHKLIIWTSQSFPTLTGHRPIDIVGKSARFLQGPATDAASVQYMYGQLRIGQPVEINLLNYRKSGEPYVCHMHIEPLYSHRGEMTHFISTEYVVQADMP